MTEEAKDNIELRIENLVLKLNNMAQRRKALLDQLWTIEENCEQLRVELLKLMSERKK